MLHEMRRARQSLSQEDCVRLLEGAASGVLALSGADGAPYAVPLSYVFRDGKLYFHCARAGHKLDLLAENPRASFCVIGQDKVVPEEYTTYYRSVVAFGTVRPLEDGPEKRTAIEALCRRYAPERTEEDLSATVDRAWKNLCLLELAVERMTGKQAVELVTEVVQ